MATTEDYYTTQEEMDATAHGSQRALFEHLLLITLEGARAGKQDPGKVQCLLDAFNAASNSTQRMTGLLRRAVARAEAKESPPCETHRLAALSTAHLTDEDARSIGDTSAENFPFVIAPFEEGWFFSCHGADDPEKRAGHGPYAEGRWPSLRAVREWAAARGYDYVLLDRDADPVADLPTYDW